MNGGARRGAPRRAAARGLATMARQPYIARRSATLLHCGRPVKDSGSYEWGACVLVLLCTLVTSEPVGHFVGGWTNCYSQPNLRHLR
ncbi:MAG: hypothetical protein GY820_15910 [Gammaproteobacteria bacterium]|nr:hypothetical protein [Gammaproteobacteria bacterium]